jgi:hypothetical protein
VKKIENQINFYTQLLVPNTNPSTKKQKTNENKNKTMSYFIKQNEPSNSFFQGGLFLDANTVPTSFITLIPSSSSSNSTTVSCFSWGIKKWVGSEILKVEGGGGGGGVVFSSLSLSLNGSDSDHSHRYTRESNEVSEQQKKKMEEGVCEEKENVRVDGSGAVNMTKHLWAGAFAAMVSRSSLLNLSNNLYTTVYEIIYDTCLLTHILIIFII